MNTKFILAGMCLAIAAISLTISSHTARAIDGDALTGLCGDVYRVTDTAQCQGYVEGIADVMSGGDSIASYKACFAKATSDEQILSAVEDYLRDAADEGADPAPRLVAKALTRAFPCRPVT